METRIIKAVFGASKSIVAPKRFKNDWGQVLELVGIELPQVFEVHFSNSKTGTAKKRVGQDNRVEVPAEYFESGADIFCWIMVHDGETDGRTMYTVRIPIEDRADATDVEPTPVEQDVITQAIAALNSAVEKTAQDVESADASAQSAKADADRAETARDTAEGYVDDVQNYAQQAQASANNASASATASAQSASTAQQIKTDVQGLVSDAQSAAGASAQSALVSAQYASQASASAISASQSAETASTKASEASNSAQTASTKATEASGYASTASAKASESSQSASASSGYATAAGQAKTAAETAQGLAEQAQVDAESAKDDAESARDEAQQIVSGISGKVEQIDQNTADITSLEADRYKAYATDTATGAVASFPDGADNIPMKDVLVHIEPVQEGSGDPSPENVRPITGWTGAKVTRTGKNLFDQSQLLQATDWVLNNDGYYYGTRFAFNVAFGGGFPVNPKFKPNTQYTLSFVGYNNQAISNTQFYINYTDGTRSTVAFGSVIPTKYTLTSTAGKTIAYVSGTFGSEGTIIAYIKDVMIEEGVSASDYKPYTSQTYSITFPVEAGAVYGGTLDVTTGVLTVDRAMVDLGSFHYTLSPEIYPRFKTDNEKPENIKSQTDTAIPINGICEIFPVVSAEKTYRGVKGLSCQPNGDLRIYAPSYSDVDSFQTAMNGVQLCYELATPITYQLTPTEIRSLLGTNNVFADTGDSTAEYRADTKLYIQKKITEAVSALA